IGPYADRRDEVLASWRQGIADLAKCPNAIMKLGGLGTHFPRDLSADWPQRAKPIGSQELAAAPGAWIHYCIEQFGPGRSFFESNFPPDKASMSYGVLYNAFKLISRRYSPSERAKLFHDTAVRVYRIA